MPLVPEAAAEVLRRHLRPAAAFDGSVGRPIPPTLNRGFSRGTEQDIARTFNDLDALMARHAPNYTYAAGYIRPIQLLRMLQLVRSEKVTHYCEVGMNGGHSVTAMLLSNPSVTAHVFDMLGLSYSRPVVELLTEQFGDRFVIHPGNSLRTLPALRKNLTSAGRDPRICDLMFVDGDHTLDGAYTDLVNMRELAAPGGSLVVDDTMMGPGRALNVTTQRRLTKINELYGPFHSGSAFNPCHSPLAKGARQQVCKHWGFAVGHFVTGVGTAAVAANPVRTPHARNAAASGGGRRAKKLSTQTSRSRV